MATIEELEARGAHIEAMEAAAVGALADAMRELAVELPDGSGLALVFAKSANDLEVFTGTWALGVPGIPRVFGGSEIRRFVRERLKEREEA